MEGTSAARTRREPACRRGPDEVAPGRRMSGRREIVILAGGMWRERWTTYQRIARELAKGRKVLYVEGNYSLGKLLKGLFRRRPYPVLPRGLGRRTAYPSWAKYWMLYVDAFPVNDWV